MTLETDAGVAEPRTVQRSSASFVLLSASSSSSIALTNSSSSRMADRSGVAPPWLLLSLSRLGVPRLDPKLMPPTLEGESLSVPSSRSAKVPT